MSAGRAWPLKLRRLLKEPGRKKQQEAEGEGRNAQNQISDWRMDTENSRVSLAASFDLPHKSPTFVAILPWVDSTKWQFNEFNGPELSSAIGSCPWELQAQPQSELSNKLWDFFSFHFLHLPKAVQSPSRLLTQYIFLLSFTF